MENWGKILTANRTNLHVLGTATLPFEINDQVYKFGAYVVQRLYYKDYISHKVILGKVALVNYNGIINL